MNTLTHHVPFDKILMDLPTKFPPICNSIFHQLLVGWHLSCSKYQGRVGGSIQRLILLNSYGRQKQKEKKPWLASMKIIYFKDGIGWSKLS